MSEQMIRAFQAGQQLKQQREAQARQDEQLKLDQQLLKLRMDEMKLESQLRARELDLKTEEQFSELLKGRHEALAGTAPENVPTDLMSEVSRLQRQSQLPQTGPASVGPQLPVEPATFAPQPTGFGVSTPPLTSLQQDEELRRQEAIKAEFARQGSISTESERFNLAIEAFKESEGRDPTAGEMFALRKEVANQSSNVPSFQSQTVMDGGKEVKANYNPRTGQFTRVDGTPIENPLPPPTSDAKTRGEARNNATRAVDVLQALSGSIITRVGPSQRADAIKRGASAVFGNDPQFRAYDDARFALAGNLAVLQQGSRPSDADIKAIWVPMVPSPYSDTSESAAIKWEMIRQMSGLGSFDVDTPVPGGGVGQESGLRILRVEEVPQ